MSRSKPLKAVPTKIKVRLIGPRKNEQQTRTSTSTS